MSIGRFWGIALTLPAVMLAAVAALVLSFGPERLPFGLSEASHPPPSAPLGESYSVSDGDPLTLTGVHPADILIAGPVIAIPCYLGRTEYFVKGTEPHGGRCIPLPTPIPSPTP